MGLKKIDIFYTPYLYAGRDGRPRAGLRGDFKLQALVLLISFISHQIGLGWPDASIRSDAIRRRGTRRQFASLHIFFCFVCFLLKKGSIPIHIAASSQTRGGPLTARTELKSPCRLEASTFRCARPRRWYMDMDRPVSGHTSPLRDIREAHQLAALAHHCTRL